MLLIDHWGDVGAFKPPVLSPTFSLAEMMDEDFEVPAGKPAGQAYYAALSLNQDWWLIDRDCSEWKECNWELYNLWLSLQAHFDNDCA